MSYALAAALGLVALGSIWFSPRAQDTAGFFRGTSRDGTAPGLLTLVFSQVTTWVFARSLMNAAILGYFYGAMGTIAYASYYLSFLTGAWIIDAIRFRHGFNSVSRFLPTDTARPVCGAIMPWSPSGSCPRYSQTFW